MKVTLTTQEIISKLGLPADTELVIEADRKIDASEWISNIGRSICCHPESLSADTKIEVMHRCGETNTGRADDWKIWWKETAGNHSAIVAYRILKD